jgi:hypothetical protein
VDFVTSPGGLVRAKSALLPIFSSAAFRLTHHIFDAARDRCDVVDVVGQATMPTAKVPGVNWSSSQGPPNIDSYGWEAKHQQVMTISGRMAARPF